ncbi:MAG: DUF2339 domain-containing protein [Chitinophagaceae bacterium]|nr:DUF2339 domain-containing protein [Chitinophagaceae bacterium]
MDGAIFLIILLPLIYLLLLLVILGKSSSQQQSLESIKSVLNQLRDQLYDIDRRVKELSREEKIKTTIPEIKQEASKESAKPAITPEPVFIKPEEEKPLEFREEVIEMIEAAAYVDTQEMKNFSERNTSDETMADAAVPKKELAIPEKNITADKTDWEKFIGENLANKIGIAVLVLGISFFVKFAIDKNWVSETGRVITGLISGGALIGLAHYIRNSYRSFSSVLVGGGLTVFYFTIAFAFHQYHLIGQQAAFIIMIIITAFAVVLSVLYNRLELAVLATVGGFITPFLVSTGQNNYVALFTYLCILNSGLLVLSWFKRWKAINIIALFFTIIIYGGWLGNQFFLVREPFPYQWAFLFATLFYLLSLTINILNNVKLNIKFGGFDFILLLSINFLYYAAGYVILDYWNEGEYQGLFTAALGILNLTLAWVFFKQKRADRNFIYLLIGLTVTFISLTAPVQLKGNHITLFWAAETVVLFWLYQRSRIHLLKIASFLIIFPLLISLFVDWSQVYVRETTIIPVIVNRGFVTTLVTAIAFLIYYTMMRKEADSYYVPEIENKLVRNILLTGGIALLYSAGTWEIYYQFTTRIPGTDIYAAYLQLYSFLFILLILQFFKKSSSFILLKFMLTVAGFIFYLFNLRINYTISFQMLSTGQHSVHFIAHWISAAILTWLLYDLISYFRKQKTAMKDYEVPFTWIASGCLIFLLSVEMYHVIVWSTYRQAGDHQYWENLYYKAGLSILWGLCSFAMMWLGMKHKFKPLRIISLTLFTVTLIKLFLYDIQNIPPGGKIAAFILLGVLLLIVSFMYQRLKKMIIDDQQKE